MSRLTKDSTDMRTSTKTGYFCLLLCSAALSATTGFFAHAAAEGEGQYLFFDPVPDPTRPALTLTLSRRGGLSISWGRASGILQAADAVAGPWTGIGYNAPYVIEPTGAQRFFRAIPAVRPVAVYVPVSYDPEVPSPLIISLHGYRLEPEFQESLIPMKPLAEERGFIYCLPRGEVNETGATQWNGADCCGIYGSTRDDVAFLAGLVSMASEHLNIDPKRVYLVGHSNGGWMAYRAACERADLFAAIASLAGATYYEASDCAPTEPVSVLQIHGTEDEAVDYNGGLLATGGPLPSAHETVDRWAVYNGCDTLIEETEKTTDLDLNIPGNDCTVSYYSNGPAGIGVELWTIHGGDHYPLATLDEQSSEIAAGIVDWLLAHPKP